MNKIDFRWMQHNFGSSSAVQYAMPSTKKLHAGRVCERPKDYQSSARLYDGHHVLKDSRNLLHTKMLHDTKVISSIKVPASQVQMQQVSMYCVSHIRVISPI
jgi:hypothetical protein